MNPSSNELVSSCNSIYTSFDNVFKVTYFNPVFLKMFWFAAQLSQFWRFDGKLEFKKIKFQLNLPSAMTNSLRNTALYYRSVWNPFRSYSTQFKSHHKFLFWMLAVWSYLTKSFLPFLVMSSIYISKIFMIFLSHYIIV